MTAYQEIVALPTGRAPIWDRAATTIAKSAARNSGLWEGVQIRRRRGEVRTVARLASWCTSGKRSMLAAGHPAYPPHECGPWSLEPSHQSQLVGLTGGGWSSSSPGSYLLGVENAPIRQVPRIGFRRGFLYARLRGMGKHPGMTLLPALQLVEWRGERYRAPSRSRLTLAHSGSPLTCRLQLLLSTSQSAGSVGRPSLTLSVTRLWRMGGHPEVRKHDRCEKARSHRFPNF